MHQDSIVGEARAHLSVWTKLPYHAEIVPSQLWRDHLAAHVMPLQELSANQLIERVTGTNATTEPAATNEPEFKSVIEAQKRWLARLGHPLSGFPSFVQESELASSSVTTVTDGRRVSRAFLYFLSIAAQLKTTVGKLASVFELGSGYGGTARVLKLLNPNARIVLCDLPETLYLCYVFLRTHFPTAHFHVLRQGELISDLSEAEDFVFVPAQLAGQIAGAKFDVMLNTCSLSEMTQPACDWYLNLIEQRIQVDYFLHLNRIGTPEELRDCCSTSFGIDRDWQVLSWQWRGDENFYNVSFPKYPWFVTSVFRRIPANIRSESLYASMVSFLRAALSNLTRGSDKWHAAMWDLIRLEKKPADIQAYLEVIRPLRWREVEYYEAMLKSGPAK